MLKSVSFAGIDNWTDFDRVKYLSTKYPFVQWAALVSDRLNETSPRYISLERLKAVSGLNLGVHLCGSITRDILKYNDWTSAQKYLSQIDCQTIQINAAGQTHIAEKLDFPSNYSIVIQMSSKNREVINSIKRKYPIYILHDNSGGKGITDTFWPPYYNLEYVGYAGGINPDNVEDIISKISSLRELDFWIDMESGIRTNDKLDLDKCERILEISQNYIK